MPKRTSSGSMPRCSARPPPTPPRMRSVRDRVRRLGWGGGCGGGVAATGSVGSWSPSSGGGVSMTTMVPSQTRSHHRESPLGNDPGDPRGDPMWQPSCLVPFPWRRPLAIVLVALTAVVVALALARVLRHDDAPSARLVPGSGEAPGSGADAVDPLAWKPDRSAAYAAAAARGLAHPLYAQSPGGVLATARRV